MDKQQIAQEALQRAQSGQSTGNFAAIFEGFGAKGIAPDQIIPRENVLTFNAWRAKGRSVKRGEHGVKVYTFIATTKTDEETGAETIGRRPRAATVFHISQTEEQQAPRPVTLCAFLALEGVQDQTGELKAMDAHRWHLGKPYQRRMVRNNGLSPDYARERAAELGYLPADSSLADFYDLVGQELRGNLIYSAADIDAGLEAEVDAAAEASRHSLELEAARLGLPDSLTQRASLADLELFVTQATAAMAAAAE